MKQPDWLMKEGAFSVRIGVESRGLKGNGLLLLGQMRLT